MQIARLLNHVVTLSQQTVRLNLPFLTKAQIRLLFIFALAYLAIFLLLQWRVPHDPGSLFFTVQGYAPKYSLGRLQQAQAFLQSIAQSDGDKQTERTNKLGTVPPRLCIGMPTARRSQEQYVDITIASLFDHLTPQERAQIQFNLLIAHTNPQEHPFYDESSSTVNASRLADNVIFYPDIAGSSKSVIDRIYQLEKQSKFNEKSYYDYSLLLHQCVTSLAPYILILEDDVLAQEGWYARTMDSLQKLEIGPGNSRREWLYLRLFFTEKFQGWHKEHWPLYLLWSCATVVLVAVILLFLRLRLSSLPASPSLPYPRSFSRKPSPKDHQLLSLPFIFIVSCLCVPALIILYFAAGPQAVQPLRPGIHVMNNYGCCSQAFIFRRNMSLALLDWFDERIATDMKFADPTSNHDHGRRYLRGSIDSAMEIFADERYLQRYALVPSAFQHIGAKTYKESKDSGARELYNVSGARGIWSFGFEQLVSPS